MKKIILSMLAIVACSALFVSCGDDDEVRHSQAASEVVVGNYVGKWVKTLADGTSTELTDGCTVTIEAGQTVNDVKVTTACAGDNSINGYSMANVAWAGNNVALANKTKSGTLNVEMTGLKGEDGTLTVKFFKSVRSGRKTVETDYMFVGVMQ